MASANATNNSNISENEPDASFEPRRSYEDVNETLNTAKLDTNNLYSCCQTIFLQSDLDASYRLLQLDNYVMDEIIQGKSVLFKGAPDEKVVLCTDTKTYDVVEKETSNSLLLIKGLVYSDSIGRCENNLQRAEISAVKHTYLELRPGKPHRHKLMSILRKGLYKGPEWEYEIADDQLFTMSELANCVQASNSELKQILDELPCGEIDGKVRLFEMEYHFRVLSYMLGLIDSNSWNLNEIDYDETLNCIIELAPRPVIISLLDRYTEPSKLLDGIQMVRYKEELVCKFLAQVLLASSNKFNYDEFMQTWSDSVPAGMQVTEDILHGIAVINRRKKPHTICGLDESDLPEDLFQRMKLLFSAKDEWTLDEITPYLCNVTSANFSVNMILSKYARATSTDGVKYFTSKLRLN